MAVDNPITEDEIEFMLNDMLQRMSEARFKRGVETERGEEALRLAMVGPYSALLRLDKIKTAQGE